MIKFPDHIPTKVIFGIVGFLLIAIPYSVWLPRYTTSNPDYCLRCHGEKGGLPNRGIEPKIHPGFKYVACVDCHSKSNQIVYEGYVRGFAAEAGRVTPNCMRCHPDMLNKNDIEGFKFNVFKIDIPHKLHLNMGASCTDCHANIAHDLSENATNRPRMEYCSQCHATSKEPCAKCHFDKIPSGPIPIAPPAGVVGDGKTLYDKYCRSCHGIKGMGVEGINLQSKEFFDKFNIQDLRKKVLEGHKQMPSFGSVNGGTLSEDEVRAIIAHLKLSTAGSISNNQALFDNYCAVCHGTKGNKMSQADLSSNEFVSKLSSDLIVRTIRMGKGSMPAFDRQHGGPLQFESILAIAKHIQVLSQGEIKPQLESTGPDGSVLYKAQCSGCHGDKGNDVPDINLRSADYLKKIGDAKFIKSVNTGTDAMPGLGKEAGGSLSKIEISAILDYLKGKVTAVMTGQEKTTMKKAPKIPHEVTKDMEDCLECHNPDGVKPPPRDHAGRTSKICKTCHSK